MKNLFTIVIACLTIISTNLQLLAYDPSFAPDSLELTQEEMAIIRKFEKNISKSQIELSDEDLKSIYQELTAEKYTFKTFQEDLFFSDNNISVRKIYPNPASAAAYLDYNLLQNIKAKITIRNILGKVVREYELPRGERKIRIPTTDFESGIYLYTLSINGQAKSSRKLIVKHD